MGSFFSSGRTITLPRWKETSEYFVNDLRLEGVWIEFTGLRGKKNPTCFKVQGGLNVLDLSCAIWLLVGMGEVHFFAT